MFSLFLGSKVQYSTESSLASKVKCRRVNYSKVKCIDVHWSSLQCIVVHFSTLQLIVVQCIAVHCSAV